MNKLLPTDDVTSQQTINMNSDSKDAKKKKRQNIKKPKSVAFIPSTSSVDTTVSTSTWQEKRVNTSAENKNLTSKVKEVKKPFVEKEKEKKKEEALSSSHDKKVKKSKDAIPVSHQEKEREKEKKIEKKISIQEIKQLLKNPSDIQGAKIKEFVFFIIPVTYSLLHPLCANAQTEEHIEFLYDYIQWSENNKQNNDTLDIEGLKKLLNTYIIDHPSSKSKKGEIDFCRSKIINIEWNHRSSIIDGFEQEDFAKVQKSLENVAPIVVSLLWHNVLHSAISDQNNLKQILTYLKD